MRTLTLAASVFASCVGSAWSDATIDYVRDGDCALAMDRLQIRGSQLRFDTAEGSGLYDGLEDTVVYLDHDGRRFHTMEVDADAAEYTADVASSTMNYANRELARAQEQIQAMCDQARAGKGACPQLPAMDMQSMMQMAQGMAEAAQAQGGSDAAAMQGVDPAVLHQMLQGQGASLGDIRAASPAQREAALTWSNTGRDDTVAGASCRWHAQQRGTRLVQEQCVASVEALPLDDRDRKGAARAVQVMQRYGRSFAPWMEAAGIDAGAEPSSQGLVLAQRCHDQDGNVRGEARARMSAATIDDARFEIPHGYRAQSLEGSP